MLSGVALALSDLPLKLITEHGLRDRIRERGGEPEVQFLFGDARRLLPVWQGGQLRVVTWGNRRDENRSLPCTGWTQLITVEAGRWADFQPESVVIPATLGLDKGVWYRIRQGIRGLLVRDERGEARVFVLCEPSTHYYQVMTRSRWMPVLVDELI